MTPRAIQKLVLAIVVVLLIVAVLLFLLWLSPWLAIKSVLEMVFKDLLAASVPWRIAVAILAIAAPPFVLALMRLTSARAPFLDETWPPKKLHAAMIVCVYIGAFSIAMYFMTRNQVFGAGRARWVCTKDYQLYERDGPCPYHGRTLLAVTPELVETIDYVKKHGAPQVIEVGADGPFRNSANGDPVVWFFADDGGKITPYGGPGFDEITGGPLRAATPELIEAYRGQVLARQAKESTARRDEAQRQQRVEQARASALALSRQIEGVRLGLAGSPKDASLYFQLGQLLVRQGDRSAAAQAFQRALWYNPNHEGAKSALESLGAN